MPVLICKVNDRLLLCIDFLKDKVEEALGVDLNKDGRIGGAGPMAAVERATHIDLNHDGIIGGYRPPASGGLVGKIESATHVDFNGDGRIGGTVGYYPPNYHH